MIDNDIKTILSMQNESTKTPNAHENLPTIIADTLTKKLSNAT